MSASGFRTAENGIPPLRDALRHLFQNWKGVPLQGPENRFPTELLQGLLNTGLFRALLAPENGGAGLCGASGDSSLLSDLLRKTGYLSLSLGRCLEGHINVVRLLQVYGTRQQNRMLAPDLKAGMLAGIWVTDSRTPVRITREGRQCRLSGIKGFASAVHQVRLALITATDEQDQTVMVLVPVGDPERILPGPGALTGMAASGTGAYDFTDVVVSNDHILGSAGDYLRQPEFSAGAWRGSAVALGGMDHLVDLLRQELADRKRADNPHQLMRIGEALILRQTAAFWVERAAQVACAGQARGAGDITATVNLCRIAVERAALELIVIVQRGLGLAAFVRGRAVEQVMRDLATYLRQPAPDEALTEAAVWSMTHDWPGEDA